MPKLKHYDDFGTARFITFSCYRRQPYLIDDVAKGLFVSQLDIARKKYSFMIMGYVIMPEHIHFVLNPPPAMKMGAVIGEIKSLMARAYFILTTNLDDRRRVFWEKRCYDHNCRTTAAVIEKINYCHNNPVKRGLVSECGEYRWSSYNWYHGIRNVPLEIDDVEEMVVQ
jgi:putative transposase